MTIIEDLKTIRVITETILRKVAGHKRRNERLSALRLEIGRIQDHFDNHPGKAFEGRETLREQITDGLRALQTLAHGGVTHNGDPETNRDVEGRLWLLMDMAAFLIDKIREAHLDSVWESAVGDIPF